MFLQKKVYKFWGKYPENSTCHPALAHLGDLAAVLKIPPKETALTFLAFLTQILLSLSELNLG